MLLWAPLPNLSVLSLLCASWMGHTMWPAPLLLVPHKQAGPQHPFSFVSEPSAYRTSANETNT